MSKSYRGLVFLSLALLLTPVACGGAPSAGPVPAEGGSEEVAEQAPDYVPTAAGAPSTDVYIGDLGAAGTLTVGNLRNVTGRDGYDNQPAFLPDGTGILYTSGRDGVQTDIYRFDLATDTVTQVTGTPSSEYSPTPVPGGGFAAIHEAAGVQQLWRFYLDGTDRGGLIIDHVQPVGYQAWGDESTVVVFVLGGDDSPATLQLVDVTTGLAAVIAEQPGRSLHRIPGRHAISFVDKSDEEDWWISDLDLATQSITRLTATLTGREDYAWTPDGTILMGDDSLLYAWSPAEDWRLVADLTEQGLRGISRIAVSPAGDRLALVGERTPGD